MNGFEIVAFIVMMLGVGFALFIDIVIIRRTGLKGVLEALKEFFTKKN